MFCSEINQLIPQKYIFNQQNDVTSWRTSEISDMNTESVSSSAPHPLFPLSQRIFWVLVFHFIFDS